MGEQGIDLALGAMGTGGAGRSGKKQGVGSELGSQGYLRRSGP